MDGFEVPVNYEVRALQIEAAFIYAEAKICNKVRIVFYKVLELENGLLFATSGGKPRFI